MITSGCTTELAHTLWTKYTRLVVNACGQQNGTREQAMLHYLPVRQATASVHRPLHYATGNLLTWQMTPLHSNEWLSRCFTCQGGSFPGFIYSSLLCTLCSKKLPEWASTSLAPRLFLYEQGEKTERVRKGLVNSTPTRIDGISLMLNN